MQGSSRGALTAAQEVLEQALSRVPDRAALAEEMFAVVATLDSNGPLRRAMADTMVEGEQRRALARRLFTGKLSEPAVTLVAEAAAQRWSSDRDLTDGLEALGVESLLAQAEADNRLTRVEEQLFHVGRTVQANPELRSALTERSADAAARDRLVTRLIGDKADAETLRLVRYAVGAPRGRRLEHVLEGQLDIAATRQSHLTALVTSAVPLDDVQVARLEAGLSKMYSRPVHVSVVIDQAVIGGLRVEIGDEVIDGTVARNLEDARRRLAG